MQTAAWQPSHCFHRCRSICVRFSRRSTYDGKSVGPRHTYYKLCLGGAAKAEADPNFVTLGGKQGAMALMKIDKINLLKIDIEGEQRAPRQRMQGGRARCIRLHAMPWLLPSLPGSVHTLCHRRTPPLPSHIFPSPPPPPPPQASSTTCWRRGARTTPRCPSRSPSRCTTARSSTGEGPPWGTPWISATSSVRRRRRPLLPHAFGAAWIRSFGGGAADACLL